jgi:large subunit ribosomal protein L27
MAHKKAGGSTALGRDSISKRLGIKLHNGQFTQAGGIIVRQRGTKYMPGEYVKKGKDDTLFAIIPGYVKFIKRSLRKFNGQLRSSRIVSVVPKK